MAAGGAGHARGARDLVALRRKVRPGLAQALLSAGRRGRGRGRGDAAATGHRHAQPAADRDVACVPLTARGRRLQALAARAAPTAKDGARAPAEVQPRERQGRQEGRRQERSNGRGPDVRARGPQGRRRLDAQRRRARHLARGAEALHARAAHLLDRPHRRGARAQEPAHPRDDARRRRRPPRAARHLDLRHRLQQPPAGHGHAAPADRPVVDLRRRTFGRT